MLPKKCVNHENVKNFVTKQHIFLEVAKINRAVLKHSPNITSLKFGGKYKKLVGSKLQEVPLLEYMEARANQHFLSFQHFGR